VRTLSNLLDMTGRVAVVTGAAGELGRVISQTLSELGAELVLVDLPHSTVDALPERLAHAGRPTARVMHCDLEQREQRTDLIRRLNLEFGEVSTLVNNAAFVGTSSLEGWSTSFESQSVETWRRAIEVNLTAAFEVSQGLIGSLRAAKGSIINIASIYGTLGPDWRLYDGTDLANPAAYAASKGGLIQFSRWLATTVAPDVRVNSISPGGIRRRQPESFVQQYESRVPLRRMATEEDLKGAIAFLASDMSAYVTGQNLMVDGGWSAW
jgi:NAD(P)-dependent dehydrogenase (short-subunit alcohol dehydrogenase family)